jgi:hypothetical protein
MKSESAAFLQKSREAFDKAQGMLVGPTRPVAQRISPGCTRRKR